MRARFLRPSSPSWLRFWWVGGTPTSYVCDCEESGTPSSLRSFDANLQEIFERLAALGEPLTEAGRVLVVAEPRLEQQTPLAWPTEFEFESLVLDPQTLIGMDPIPEGNEVPLPLLQELRAMQDRHLETWPHTNRMATPLPVTYGGEAYGVYLRDTLPLSLPHP